MLLFTQSLNHYGNSLKFILMVSLHLTEIFYLLITFTSLLLFVLYKIMLKRFKHFIIYEIFIIKPIQPKYTL